MIKQSSTLPAKPPVAVVLDAACALDNLGGENRNATAKAARHRTAPGVAE